MEKTNNFSKTNNCNITVTSHISLYLVVNSTNLRFREVKSNSHSDGIAGLDSKKHKQSQS